MSMNMPGQIAQDVQAMRGSAPPMTGGGKGGVGQVPSGGPQEQSAWAYNQALNSANAMGPVNYHQMMSPGQLNANQQIAGRNALMNGQGAQTVAGADVSPDRIAKGIGGYMNPFENQVVRQASKDLMRQNSMMQNQNNAAAAQAGAFGGSRHGIVGAQTNAETQRALADMTSQMRQQGWNTAAGLSAQDVQNRMTGANMQMQQGQILAGLQGQDIANRFNQANLNQQAGMFNIGNNMTADQFNASARSATDQFNQGNLANRASMMSGLSQQGFDVGNYLTNQQNQYGAQQQALMQQILTGGAQQFDQYMNSPLHALNVTGSSISGNPLQGNSTSTGTSSYTPGIGDYVALGAQTYGQAKGGKGGR